MEDPKSKARGTTCLFHRKVAACIAKVLPQALLKHGITANVCQRTVLRMQARNTGTEAMAPDHWQSTGCDSGELLSIDD